MSPLFWEGGGGWGLEALSRNCQIKKIGEGYIMYIIAACENFSHWIDTTLHLHII